MSSCLHPPTAQFIDRSRGTVTCTICGEVVNDQQLELDPQFARGERPANTAGRGGLRSLGSLRPRSGHHTTPVSQRPSVDYARREMANIARQLEMSGDHVEMAAGIYKLAVTNNAIAGARPSILCACLYAVCRHEGTSHTVYDFSDATKESPYDILRYMRYLCRVTHTAVEPMDASVVLMRFAELLNLGEQTQDVALFAAKLIRIMREEWIEQGRRPLGVAAAALLVACQAFGIVRSADALCGVIRLTADTVHRRLDELLQCPANSTLSIDDYVPSGMSAPPAFSRNHESEALRDDEDNKIRQLASLYYDLVAEAKRGDPPTDARCERWKTFVVEHCALNHQPLQADKCELRALSQREQLDILGLPHAVPLNANKVKVVTKTEEIQMVAGSTQPTEVEPLTMPQFAAVKLEAATGSGQGAAGGGDPNAFYDLFSNLVKDNNDVRELNELDFSQLASIPTLTAPAAMQNGNLHTSNGEEDETGETDAPAGPGNAWDFVQLPSTSDDTDEDIMAYIVWDNEMRLQLWRTQRETHGAAWEFGSAKTKEQVMRARRTNVRKRHREQEEFDTLQAAVQRALRSKGGASVINTSQLDALIPGLSTSLDGGGVESDNVSVTEDDW